MPGFICFYQRFICFHKRDETTATHTPANIQSLRSQSWDVPQYPEIANQSRTVCHHNTDPGPLVLPELMGALGLEPQARGPVGPGGPGGPVVPVPPPLQSSCRVGSRPGTEMDLAVLGGLAGGNLRLQTFTYIYI